MAGEMLEHVSNYVDYSEVIQPISGNPTGKHFLSAYQLSAPDIADYMVEAEAAEAVLASLRRGAPIVPYAVLKVVMQQPSTRTGGSMTTAMQKMGGIAELYSGMQASSEAKGESPADTWVAFATQADIIGTRTPQVYGPAFAALSIERSLQAGKLRRRVPIINLGDGINEHPTQTMGDLFTIRKHFYTPSDGPAVSRVKDFEGLELVAVGDHERYRALHSLYIAAATLGIKVTAVESRAAPVPDEYVWLLGDRLQRTDDLDGAMKGADVLYVGRNPDEYVGDNPEELDRSRKLAHSYAGWIVDHDRLQQMPKDSALLHPRPRRDELELSVDSDPRALDVPQMENMIPARMAVLARHLGTSVLA
ncbi:hypothetical protein EYC58_00030 [Candidatus Saccharibacteria bacterium]|nr:MAG: hypothetical protein EYC58_00030 [Candidatus Saccharibacteria bacterium]